MVFRTAGAVATLLIGLGASSGEVLAQYYPPAHPYPPPHAYPPPQGYPPHRPSVADADDNQLYHMQGPPLPPAAVEPQATEPAPPGPPYRHRYLAYTDDAATAA